jgi:hypothetical protein
MNRRDCTVGLAGALIAGVFAGCAKLGFTFGSPDGSSGQAATPATGQRGGRGGAAGGARGGGGGGRGGAGGGGGGGGGGITTLSALSDVLDRAKCPLTPPEIEFLQTLKEGTEFAQRMNECLDQKQIEAVKNAGSSRGR